MKIYISGALKGSKDLISARALYDKTAEFIGTCGHAPYVPHQNTDPIRAAEVLPSNVFKMDVAHMRSASGVIAFLNEPSLGVGAELAICAQERIPVLALHEANSDVSRFALGLLETYDDGDVVQYGDWNDVEIAIAAFFQSLLLPSAKRAAVSR